VNAAPPQPTHVDEIKIRPWPEPVLEAVGHDPRSHYVETFWLGILGPSTTWLLRRIAMGFDTRPDGFELDLRETALALGLGNRRSRHSPFARALVRLVQFELARPEADGELAVRRKVPPLSRWQVTRLPASLQAMHEALQEDALRTPTVEHLRRRARQLALSLLELGEDREAGERQLLRWRYHPALAREAAEWAWDRHCRARAEEATALKAIGGAGGDAA
jgi:hypothetical protein